MTFTVLLPLLGIAVSSALAADIGVVEEIVAKVNGDIITRSEIERSKKQFEAEIRQRGTRSPDLDQAVKEHEKDFLRDRIDQLLLVQKGKELNINVDQEVSKYLADLQLKSKIADTDKFQEFVREQTGMPFEDFKSETKNGMLTQRVIGQEVSSRINVSLEERQKYYEEHKKEFVREERVFLREILVSTEGKDPAGVAAAEKKAKDLAARAKKGDKFPDLARDNSDNPATAEQGGEVGWFKKGDLDKKIEDLVFAQDRNFVTDPIRVPNGFLILKVDEHQKAGQATFEEAEPEIRDRLFTPRMQPRVREYLTKLRERAFLEIKDGFVDSGAAPGKDTRWTDPAQLKPETVTKQEVISKPRRKHLLWVVPIPGTKTVPKAAK